MSVQEKAKQYALEAWGIHVNNYCDHELSEMTLGEISEKDFTEGYKAGRGDASVEISILKQKLQIAVSALYEIIQWDDDMDLKYDDQGDCANDAIKAINSLIP